MTVRRVLASVALIAALLPTPSAVAQTSQQIGWCMSSGTPEEMIEGCTAMIKSRQYRGDRLAVIYNRRAIAYTRKGEYDQAIEDYNQSILHDISNSDIFYNRGLAYHRKGNIDHAITDFTRAITGYDASRHPLDYKRDYFYARANAYRDKNNFDLAVADYNESVKLDPNFARAIYNRGEAKQKKGDAAGGEADITKAKALQEGIGPEQ